MVLPSLFHAILVPAAGKDTAGIEIAEMEEVQVLGDMEVMALDTMEAAPESPCRHP